MALKVMGHMKRDIRSYLIVGVQLAAHLFSVHRETAGCDVNVK